MKPQSEKNSTGSAPATNNADGPATDHTDGEAAPISKSARKRQMHHLQQLGTALVDLKPGLVEALQPSAVLVDAIALARATSKREALRRQLQFIGKLMRKEDPEVIARIEKLLDELHTRQQAGNQQHHNIERWRDQLLANPAEVIEQLIAEYPQADRQWLRQISRQHQQEVKASRPPVAARKLFTYLRELLEKSA